MNHERVNVNTSYASCGIAELSRLGDEPEEMFYAIASSMYHPARGAPVAFVMWSGTLDGSAQLFAGKLIPDWGQVMVSDSAENPKTSNIIRVWLWKVDHATFKSWYLEERVRRLKRG